MLHKVAFGIDRLSLSLWASDVTPPVRRDSWAPWESGSIKQSSDGTLRPGYWHPRVPVGEGTVFVSAREGVPFHDRAPYWVRVDWNPSTQLFGKSGRLATVAETRECVGGVAGAVLPFVRVRDWSEAKVTRVDLTRDLRDNCVEETLGLLASRRAVRVIRGKYGDVETVYWNGPGSCRVMAYNKGRERGWDREDVLRVEVRCSRPWIGRHGVTTLDTLDSERLGIMGLFGFAESGWDSIMMTDTKQIVRELMHRGDLSDKQIMSFLGWCVARTFPGGPEVSGPTLAKYRRIEKSLGGVDVSVSASHSVQLDLEAGEVVRRPLAS